MYGDILKDFLVFPRACTAPRDQYVHLRSCYKQHLCLISWNSIILVTTTFLFLCSTRYTITISKENGINCSSELIEAIISSMIEGSTILLIRSTSLNHGRNDSLIPKTLDLGMRLGWLIRSLLAEVWKTKFCDFSSILALLLYTWLGALREGWYLTWTAREWWLHHQGLQSVPAVPERESSSCSLHENGQQSNCVSAIDSKPLALHHVNVFHQLGMWVKFHMHAYHQHFYTSYCLMTDNTQIKLTIRYLQLLHWW